MLERKLLIASTCLIDLTKNYLSLFDKIQAESPRFQTI